MFDKIKKAFNSNNGINSLDEFFNKGMTYSQKGNVKKALEMFEKGENLCRKSNDDINLAKFLCQRVFTLIHGITMHKIDLYNLEKADKLNSDATRICERLSLNKLLFACYRDKATILSLRQNPNESLKWFKKALELAKIHGDSKDIEFLERSINFIGNSN
ncbi:MAG: hypothetical protein FWH29_00580 [Methanobrevibacter sp.]|nr:hypothetical protein [Methanobrevibacter sp.]